MKLIIVRNAILGIIWINKLVSHVIVHVMNAVALVIKNVNHVSKTVTQKQMIILASHVINLAQDVKDQKIVIAKIAKLVILLKDKYVSSVLIFVKDVPEHNLQSVQNAILAITQLQGKFQ
ncbi:hypothetical protein TTHERM_000096791 (macronuclear) [Tetrahymena thermophila SB210]|uniref:Uncharacterized protein n=1 Tax=Tetrahymena thermophila (strain SB210) TaxID=312017 RepID=W7X7N7_TETTS|nr:hypothetical protein TTHERM_000096791 [Tetrahymena thermophila SB210]EWS75380.1 hypothetical protein TTHERM_000096791 [Tetrahymena thermophila SB210]|eukprot:XP_012652054.1 hypothetical protein TTHERM_000096791 [Tetrahymena thermophila SB210]